MKREIKCKDGTFVFELIDSPGPSPLIDAWFNSKHIGWLNYMDLETASDIELLNAVNFFFESNED